MPLVSQTMTIPACFPEWESSTRQKRQVRAVCSSPGSASIHHLPGSFASGARATGGWSLRSHHPLRFGPGGKPELAGPCPPGNVPSLWLGRELRSDDMALIAVGLDGTRGPATGRFRKRRRIVRVLFHRRRAGPSWPRWRIITAQVGVSPVNWPGSNLQGQGVRGWRPVTRPCSSAS